MPPIEQLISRKRDGQVLSRRDIQGLVEGITGGAVSDAQIAALAMAIYFRGLADSELSALTLAMRDSGAVLQWHDLDGPVVDKHSTGGVGDLVSLVVGPLVAACGAFVPMISGRGLGHTGGTVDKLESIPGLDLFPELEQLRRQVKEVGVVIVGQSADLAPADGRIYTVRDTTATVDSIPLIVSSILSKKLAEGLDGLVLDIKCGNGAFMRTGEQAHQLAGEINRIAAMSGVSCRCIITDMSQPLAWSAGNAVEVTEAIDFLTGQGAHPRLAQVIDEIAVEMLMVGDLKRSREAARALVASRLADGSAAERFAAMIHAQGGPPDILECYRDILPAAVVIKPVFPAHGGYVSSVDTRSVGSVVVELGGGRRFAGHPLNPAVGLSCLAGVGDQVGSDEPLGTVHANSEDEWSNAAMLLRQSYRIEESKPPVVPVIIGVV